jgi:CHAT domain-containing protein
VVRVQPTCGIDSPAPKKFGTNARVLFVSAEPIDQAGLSWEDIAAVIERTLAAEIPGEVSVKVIEGATRRGLLQAVNRETFDVFHFFGHGTLKGSIGHLVLEESKTGNSDYLSAPDLAVALAGKGVRLAILSACLTGAGRFTDDFGVIATALIKAGIPAVVANQYPIPIKSISPFVGSIYSSLVRNGNIDSAVANGRVALAVGIGGATVGNAVVEWGIPTLYRLADAQQIFQGQP